MLGKMFKKEPTNTIFLHELLKKDFDKEWLSEVLKNKQIDINYLDEENNSFLMKCLIVKKLKASMWLLGTDIKVNVVNNNNQSTFDLALQYGNKDIVKFILDNDSSIDINIKDKDNRTLLQNMVVQGKNNIAKILVQYGANINNTDNHGRNVIYDALSYGDESFISYITKVDGLDLDVVDEDGNTIMLHTEVLKNDTIAKDLLKAKANPMIKNKEDESFLIKTALRGEEADEVIDVLLENCTEDHSPSMIMQDLIEVSANMVDDQDHLRDRLLATAKKSMKAGAVAGSGSDGNATALIDAVKLNDFDLVTLLLSADELNINIQNEFGNTALIESVFDGMKNINIIKLLMKNGADTTIKNKKNQTVYEILNLMEIHNLGTNQIRDYELLFRVERYGNYYEVLSNILKLNKDGLDFLDSRGNPLFFMPLINNHFTLYKLYIKYGIDVHMLNKAKHNIFFEYVTQVFKKNKPDKEFRNNLSSLLSLKVDKNAQDGLGWTILHKIIASNCSIELFKILLNIAAFDYKIADNLGRTALH